MHTTRKVTVTLPVDCWQAIMRFIKSSCESKGDDWVRWGQDVNRIILRSIYSPVRKRVGHEAIQKQNINEDEPDADQSIDKPYPDHYHNPDFGQWIDVGGGNRVWDSYVDDD